MLQPPDSQLPPEDSDFVRLSGREWLMMLTVCVVGVLVTAFLVFHIGSKLPHVG